MSNSSTLVINPWKKLSPDLVQEQIQQEQNQPSLGEIMSEELAQSLQERERRDFEKKFDKNLLFDDNMDEDDAAGTSKDHHHSTSMSTTVAMELKFFDDDEGTKDCSNDLMLAQYLQMEFDREYDRNLSREEEKFNGNDKVKVSFEKYRTTHPYVHAPGEDSSSDDEDEDRREYRNQRIDTRQPPKIGPSGVIRTNDRGFVTKHDKVICGRRNTSNMLEFPPAFQTGDAAKTDMQLSNHVYNKLKMHSLSEEKRHRRLHEKKERSTAEMALDANTRLVLYKFVNGGLLESINGAVATGKESTVFHAFGGSTEDGKEVPAECAVKVFKTTLNEFKNRIEYVKDDYRFKNPRKVLKVWAEREMMNLSRMQRAGIKCPSVVKLKKHVLVMSFIGEDGCGAPKLKDVDLDEDKLRDAYDQCVEAITKMYKTCQLVHGDLSEFNILYFNETCWIIDVSQSMDNSHPRALVFLARDCHNLTEFFLKRGLDVQSRRELFNEITGLTMESEENFYLDVQKFATANRNANRTRDRKNPGDALLRQVREEREQDADVWEDDEDFVDH